MEKNKPKFKVGDKVNFTNDYGVDWGEKIIKEVREITYSKSGWGYIIDPTDSPWCAVKEELLTIIEEVS